MTKHPTSSNAACNRTAPRFRNLCRNHLPNGKRKKKKSQAPSLFRQTHKDTKPPNSHLLLGWRALGAGTGPGSFYRRLGHRGRLLGTLRGNERKRRGCACGVHKGRDEVWSRRDTGRHWRFFPARSPPPSLWRHCVYIGFSPTTSPI